MRILFQGDSITDGGRYKDEAKRWDLNHQIGHAYPYVITSLLGATRAGEGFEFINRGVSGDTVARMYARWRQDALCLKPDLISILIGVNDVCSYVQDGSGSPPERFEKLYRLALDEALEENKDIKLVLMEPFILKRGDLDETWTKRAALMPEYQAVTRRVAQDYGAVFVPTQEKLDALCQQRDASYWVWDGCHPTEAGHGVLALEWMRRTGLMPKF